MTGCGYALSVVAALTVCAGVAGAQPANDDCSNAIVLSDGSVETGSLVDATNDGTASCGFSEFSPDVWYRLTPEVSGPVTISLCNMASFDTVMSLHDGCGGSELNCNDDGDGCDLTSELVVELAAGVTYWVRVAGFDGEIGDFTITMTGGGAPPVPANDACENAMTVMAGTSAFTTTNATTDGPAHASCLSNGETLIRNDVWFSFTATEHGNLVVSTCGSSFDTFMAVYEGEGCGEFEARLLACNDDAQCGDDPSVQSVAVVPVTAGQSYTIRVGGFGGAMGDGVLELSMQAPDGDRFAIVFSEATFVPGVGTVENEDVVSYNTGTGAWTLLFDGSDVGLSALAISGFALTTENDFLFAFTEDATIPGMSNGPAGTVLENSDIVRFVPLSLGGTTTGNFIFYFDGSDVGLTHNHEAIDAISRFADGRLIISLVSNGAVAGVNNVKPEDLLVFTPTLLGPTTTGTFAMYFEGSDVALKRSGENVDAVAFASNGSILLSTTGDFDVEGLSGPNEDIFSFTAATLGTATSGTFAALLDLDMLGIAMSANVSAMERLPAAPLMLEDGRPATIAPLMCVADFDRDGAVGSRDLFAYMTAFFVHEMPADFDASGGVEIADLLGFLSAFLAGCQGAEDRIFH